MKARWKTILEGGVGEAILAVDLYNQSARSLRFERFSIQMHFAWLYLSHPCSNARDSTSYAWRYRNGSWAWVRIDLVALLAKRVRDVAARHSALHCFRC